MKKNEAICILLVLCCLSTLSTVVEADTSTDSNTLQENLEEVQSTTNEKITQSTTPSVKQNIDEVDSQSKESVETDKVSTEFSSTLDDPSDENRNISKLSSTPESAFSVSDGYITGYDTTIGGENVVIPSTINGRTITTIGNSAFSGKGIKSVRLSNTITQIESSAFSDNPNLTSVEFSSNLVRIGSTAFRNCGITGDVTIPDSVTDMGSNAFQNNKITDLIIGTGLSSIPSYAFSSNPLVTVAFGGASRIGTGAFSGAKISDLRIPSSVKQIDDSAFANSGITVLSLSEGLNYIGANAFSNNKFKRLDLPNSVTTIERSAFKSGDLTFVKTGTGLKEIKNSVFSSNKINTINFSSVETIGTEAFSHNDFGDLTIPDSVKNIGTYAFAFSAIQSVQGGKNLEIIGNNAFQQNNITKLNLENSPIIKQIGDYAFYGNPAMPNLVIPGSVLSIGTSAFEKTPSFINANNSMTLTLGEGIQSIGSNAFYGNSITHLKLPKSLTSVGNAAFSFNLLPYLDLNSTNPRINYGIQKLGNRIIDKPVEAVKAKINLGELYPGINTKNIKITRIKYGSSSSNSQFDYDSTTGELVFDSKGTTGSTLYYDYIQDGITILSVEQYLAYGNIYTATWSDWNNTLIQKDTYTGLYGDTIIATPPSKNPTRPGYTFTFWSRNPSGIPNQNYYYITQNTDFTAKYKQNRYIVNFDPDYPDGTVTSSSVTWEQSQLDELRIPKRVGYDFTGWLYNGKLIKSTDTVASLLNNIDPGNNGELLLTAKWEKKKVYFTVPDSISFGKHKISKGINYYGVKDITGSPLTIYDERGIGNQWQLTAKLSSELINSTTAKELPNSLVYKSNKDEKILSSHSAQLIAKHTTNSPLDTVKISDSWSNQQGLLLKAEQGQISVGDYDATIEWTLTDSPSN